MIVKKRIEAFLNANYTNPCLEVVLSMKKNFLLIQGIF
jgi:hypothetical protein